MHGPMRRRGTGAAIVMTPSAGSAMPKLKCPSCGVRGATGRPGDPDAEVEIGARIDGTTRSLFRCLRCDSAFARGPFGRGEVIDRGIWDRMTWS